MAPVHEHVSVEDIISLHTERGLKGEKANSRGQHAIMALQIQLKRLSMLLPPEKQKTSEFVIFVPP